MSGKPIPTCSSVRDLGVTVTPDLHPRLHILDVLSRAGRVANFILRAFGSKIPAVYLTAYRALVLPIVLYACEAWRPWNKKDILSIEKLQNRFVIRVALRCGISRDDIHIPSVTDLFDARDRRLTYVLLRHRYFSDFFVFQDSITRARYRAVIPRARNNTVSESVRWRLVRLLNGDLHDLIVNTTSSIN